MSDRRPLRDTLPDDVRIQRAIIELRGAACGESIHVRAAADEAIALLEMFSKLRLRAERVETLLAELEADARVTLEVLRS